MKKIGFIFGIHGLVFTVYMILNMVIEDYIYAFLNSTIGQPWLVAIADIFVSGSLYAMIYAVVYFIYKFFVVKVKHEILDLKGKWYHVHIKVNDNGVIRSDFVRAGETDVAQDLYDLKFTATNYSYSLGESGEVVVDRDMRTSTGWSSWSVDWNGGDKLVTCFKANTQVKVDGEYTNRHGIHRLTVSSDRQLLSGDFADEYPSKNRGEIYFFRSEDALHEFIKSFFLKNARAAADAGT